MLFLLKAIHCLQTTGELLQLVEVGALSFNHYCIGCDDTQLNVLHSVNRRLVRAI